MAKNVLDRDAYRDPRERLCFTIGAFIILAYIVLRAVLVPVIHDEARTFQLFVRSGGFLPFQAEWDAANHVLVTALAQVSYALWGPGLLSLRIWSVLGFVLYARYTWIMGVHIASPTVRWCLWAALLCTPFVLDFFSLFRGYGLAMAFLLMAVHHIARFAEKGYTRDLCLALLAIAIATFGSLSLLLMWGALLGFAVLVIMLRAEVRSMTLIRSVVVALGLVLLAVAVVFSVGLSQHGAFYFGSTEGLFRGTLKTLAYFVTGTDRTWFLVLVVVLLVTILLMAGSVRRSIILERQASLMVVCASLLLADLIGRIVLGEAFAVRYPTDRTAMQLVPLFLILLAQCIDRASASIHVAHFASLALLLLPLRALLTANFDHTMYWSEQSIPDAIFLIAEERQRGLGRPLMINAQRHLQPCWWYGNMIRGISANELDPTDFPQASCDLLMIDPAREGPLPGFRVIATASTGHIQLLERIVPIHVRLMVDSILTIGPSNAEYVDLWKPAISASGGEEAFVEFDAKLTTGAAFAGALVLEVSDRNAEHLFYQKLLLDRGRIGWRGDRLHIALRLPPVATPGARIAFYLFDPHREHFRVDDAHVRIHRVEA